MHNSWADAIAFVPKRDIFFMGFAFHNHYNKKDFKLIYKTSIDGVESPEIEVEIT